MIYEIIENSCKRIENCAKDIGLGKSCKLNDDDKKIMKREFSKESNFDPIHIRQRIYNDWLIGKNIVTCFSDEYAKFIILSSNNFILSQTLRKLWFWIIRSFCPTNLKGRIRIFFLADTSLRKFPDVNERKGIGPENINGGYTYPCQQQLDIFIYRIEDATRVLIHELLHAFCTDKHETGVDITEAKTEAWAELLWCCFIAKGDANIALANFEAQIGWSVLQNERVMEFIGPEKANNREFPWRYTIGKEEIFRIWMGVQNLKIFKKKVGGPLADSLRLTNPYI